MYVYIYIYINFEAQGLLPPAGVPGDDPGLPVRPRNRHRGASYGDLATISPTLISHKQLDFFVNKYIMPEG